jgi:hypothetical protein
MKRIGLTFAFLGAFAALCVAEGGRGQTSLEVQAVYGFPNREAYQTSSVFAPIQYGVLAGDSTKRALGSAIGSPEGKVILAHKLAFPMLAGEGALTRGNNLALDISGELSPVSLNANVQATLTPIAFLKFAAGAGLGTGWDIGFVGLGINDPVAGIKPQNFGGIVYRAWATGTFQFDLAALMPGEWNHVILLASPKIQYQAYSNASADEAWVWEADKGMNFNGFKLWGTYLLGYQMPLVLDLAGILLQTEGWLGDVREKSVGVSGISGWGSDYTYLIFGPLFDFRMNEKSTIAILTQFKTGIKWSDATMREVYFGNRVYEGSYAYFYRLVFDYTLKL